MQMKDQKQAAAIAEERLKMIAPLLSPTPDKAAAAQMRGEICEQYAVSGRTLDRYCKSYLSEGFEGLKPSGRKDNNNYKIPQELLAEAIRLKRELPGRSVPTIIQILELERKAEPGFLKRTTLQDALAREGYSSSMMKIYQDRGFASQRFERSHRHDLWQGDIKYGPILRLNGKPTQTYFACLIDDRTRYILHAEFYANMEQSIVEDTLKKAITKYGAPRRLYFDNGSQYRTHWMKRACGLMGIRLIYARPRNPQGKGKQERFNLTVDAFLDEIALSLPQTLEGLNIKFNAWLCECYLSKEHSAIGTTPQIAFKSDSMPPRFIETDILARAFLHCESRKADKSGCISFNSMKYDLGVKYAGRQVDVIYDPADTEILTVEAAGELPFQVHKLNIGEHVAPRPVNASVKTIMTDHSRLLDAVSENHADKEQQCRRAISYSSEAERGKG
jgi:transposase InsO family protein